MLLPEIQALIDDRLMPLGPGTPNEAVRPQLQALNDAIRDKAKNLDFALACMAGLWLYHDFLDESHSISQDLHTIEGSYWHAIMHRREPDHDNARYWFHRVGRHDAFYTIARAATPYLVQHGETRLSAQLLPNGLWNPFAFIDACAELGRKTPESPSSTVVQHLQRIELESIIHHLLDPHPKMPVEADS